MNAFQLSAAKAAIAAIAITKNNVRIFMGADLLYKLTPYPSCCVSSTGYPGPFRTLSYQPAGITLILSIYNCNILGLICDNIII